MESAGLVGLDLSAAKAEARRAAQHWGLSLGSPFATANVSYVAPAGLAVVKVAWEGDDESLHEPDALLWNGDGAVRLIDRVGRAVLEERAIPGTDLSVLGEAEATSVAVDLSHGSGGRLVCRSVRWSLLCVNGSPALSGPAAS